MRSFASPLQRRRPVGEVGPVPDLLPGAGGGAAGDPRDGHEVDGEDGVVEGEDAQEAAHVERGVAVRGGAGIEEDPGDQEAGEPEEQVDPAPPGAGDAAREPEDEQAPLLLDEAEVVGDDREDGHAAHAVERRDVLAQRHRRPGGQGLRAGGRHRRRVRRGFAHSRSGCSASSRGVNGGRARSLMPPNPRGSGLPRAGLCPQTPAQGCHGALPPNPRGSGLSRWGLCPQTPGLRADQNPGSRTIGTRLVPAGAGVAAGAAGTTGRAGSGVGRL